jgi:hypothetical protein
VTGVLVSLYNGEAPALGLIDPDSLQFAHIDLPGHLPARGVTGLAAEGDRVYAVLYDLLDETGLPTRRSALMVLDRASLRMLSQSRIRLGLDVHSIAVLDGTVYAVSTGTDEVLELRLTSDRVISERVYWRPDDSLGRGDHHHLNSIIARDGELIVSGFGRRSDVERWSSARDGFIHNVTRDRNLVRGIYQPHSVHAFPDGLGYCESPLRAARLPAGRSCEQLPGYSRGMCAVGSKLLVGTSRGRADAQGKSNVVRLDAASLRVEAQVDLGHPTAEIYDLLPWAA